MYPLEQGGLVMWRETTVDKKKVSVLRKVAQALYEGQCSLSHCISSWKKLISIFTHINCFISLQGSEAQFRPIISNLLSCVPNSTENCDKAELNIQSKFREGWKPWRWKLKVLNNHILNTIYLQVETLLLVHLLVFIRFPWYSLIAVFGLWISLWMCCHKCRRNWKDLVIQFTGPSVWSLSKQRAISEGTLLLLSCHFYKSCK